MQTNLPFRRSLTAATLAAMVVSTTAPAHGIWFAQRAKQLTLIYGIDADDLDMAKRLPHLESITAFDAEYRPIKAVASYGSLWVAPGAPRTVAGRVSYLF